MRSRHHDAAPREREGGFRGAFEPAATRTPLIELDGRLRVVNRSMCEMLGYSEAEMPTPALLQLGYPDDRSLHEERRQRLLAGEIDSGQRQKRHLHRDRRILAASTSGRGATFFFTPPPHH